MKIIQITDAAVIEQLLLIQRQFVEKWNHAELNNGIGQTNDLPGGATYNGSCPSRRVSSSSRVASFVLPAGTWVCIVAKAPWRHWHDGLSFCRNQITSASLVRKVVVYGSITEFESWLRAVGPMLRQP